MVVNGIDFRDKEPRLILMTFVDMMVSTMKQLGVAETKIERDSMEQIQGVIKTQEELINELQATIEDQEERIAIMMEGEDDGYHDSNG